MDRNTVDRQPTPANVPVNTSHDLDPQLVEVVRVVQLLLAEADKPREEKENKPDEQLPLFWKMCSAALLSISALISVTLYNQLNTAANQLHGDVGQLRDELGRLRHDLVPKDDYTLRLEQIVKGIKDNQASNKAALEMWRERAQEQKTTVADLRQQIKALERDLQSMREQLSILEQRAGTSARSPLPKTRNKRP
jgi:hypothetical protein